MAEKFSKFGKKTQLYYGSKKFSKLQEDQYKGIQIQADHSQIAENSQREKDTVYIYVRGNDKNYG